MKIDRKLAAIILLLCVGSATLAYAVTRSIVIHNEVPVYTSNVEAYWDQNGTTEVTRIEWDIMHVGTSQNKTIYLYNPGTVGLALSMFISNILPAEVDPFVTVSWDLTGTLEAKTTLAATIVIAVDSTFPTGVGLFEFDLHIEGTEV